MIVLVETTYDDEDFIIFKHEGLSWMIDKEDFRIYHYETGWEVKEVFKGSKYRTVVKRFKEWWTNRMDREEKTELIKSGPYKNGKK